MKYCKDCKWYIPKTWRKRALCSHPEHLNFITGEACMECHYMRKSYDCGLGAKLFEPKETEPKHRNTTAYMLRGLSMKFRESK